MKTIAHIHSDFPTKFGIPKQSGTVEALKAQIIFEPEYRNPDAVRGIEDFSHIWLIWSFSQAVREDWSPTVRPPRLGGNTRVGVFATRSPYRPNAVGLSSVRLERVEYSDTLGPILHVAGADLMDGTPIYDIKPYLLGVDCHPDAVGGFTQTVEERHLGVEIPPELEAKIPVDKLDALRGVLAQDPRPAYHKDPQRVYGMEFGGFEVKFRVEDHRLIVTDVI